VELDMITLFYKILLHQDRLEEITKRRQPLVIKKTWQLRLRFW